MPRDRTARFDEPASSTEDDAQSSDGEVEASEEDSESQPQGSETEDTDSTMRNLREDGEQLLMYVEPEVHDTVKDGFSELKRSLKREQGILLQKNRHYYKAMLSVAEDNWEEVTAEARRLAEEEAD